MKHAACGNLSSALGTERKTSAPKMIQHLVHGINLCLMDPPNGLFCLTFLNRLFLSLRKPKQRLLPLSLCFVAKQVSSTEGQSVQKSAMAWWLISSWLLRRLG